MCVVQLCPTWKHVFRVWWERRLFLSGNIALRAKSINVRMTASLLCSASRLDSQEASAMSVTVDTTSLTQAASLVTVLVGLVTATRTRPLPTHTKSVIVPRNTVETPVKWEMSCNGKIPQLTLKRECVHVCIMCISFAVTCITRVGASVSLVSAMEQLFDVTAPLENAWWERMLHNQN